MGADRSSDRAERHAVGIHVTSEASDLAVKSLVGAQVFQDFSYGFHRVFTWFS